MVNEDDIIKYAMIIVLILGVGAIVWEVWKNIQ